MTRKLHQEDGYPVTTNCQVLGLSCSSYYHLPSVSSDVQLEAAIPEIQTEFPTYGHGE